MFGTPLRSSTLNIGTSFKRQDSVAFSRRPPLRPKTVHTSSDEDSDDGNTAHDRTPLISGSSTQKSPVEGYGVSNTNPQPRRKSTSTDSNRSQRKALKRGNSFPCFDVNNPPSMPPSPQMDGDNGVDDVMVSGG